MSDPTFQPMQAPPLPNENKPAEKMAKKTSTLFAGAVMKSPFALEEEEKPSNLPLMILSLFLMLLAFFILMNVLSTVQETEYKQFAQSFNNSFLIDDDGEGISPPIVVSDAGQFNTPQSALSAVKKLLVKALPVAEITEHHDGSRLMVELPFHELFVGQSAQLRLDRVRGFGDVFTILNQDFGNRELTINAMIFMPNLSDERATTRQTGQELQIELQARSSARGDLAPLDDTPGTIELSFFQMAQKRAVSLTYFLTNALEEGNKTNMRGYTALREMDEAMRKDWPDGMVRFRFYSRFTETVEEEVDTQTPTPPPEQEETSSDEQQAKNGKAGGNKADEQMNNGGHYG